MENILRTYIRSGFSSGDPKWFFKWRPEVVFQVAIRSGFSNDNPKWVFKCRSKVSFQVPIRSGFRVARDLVNQISPNSEILEVNLNQNHQKGKLYCTYNHMILSFRSSRPLIDRLESATTWCTSTTFTHVVALSKRSINGLEERNENIIWL